MLVQMKPGVFREEYIAIIIRELLRGLEYLHTEGKLHRDIKGKPVEPFRSSRLTHCPCRSCKYSSFCWRGGEIGRLRCLWTVVWHAIREEEYVRRHTILDVARSYQAKWL